ncbi:MAG: cytochrome c biogenesis protein CcdA [Patescibacteria group bacterium]
MSRLKLLIITVLALLAVLVFFKFSPWGTSFLWSISQGGTWLLPLVMIASLIDSINPCAFSILFLTVAFLFNLGRSRGEILKIGGVYILGIFLVYLSIGLGLLQVLHLFNTPHFMAKIGAGLLVAWGSINLINQFFPRFPIKLKIPSFIHADLAKYMHRATLPAALALGVLVGLCEFPCTGGPYLMILGLLHDKATWTSGFSYLILYNLIFVLPLVIILVFASQKQLHDQVKAWRKQNVWRMELVGNIILLALGLAIFFL